MPYASFEDLIERAGSVEILQIADRDKDGTPDPDVIEAALVHADNTVNGYLGTRYSVPLPSTPDLVRTWSVSIARYFLFRNGATAHVRKDYEDALAALKDVARGQISLPVEAGTEEPTQIIGQHMASIPPQVFSPEKLWGWKC